MGADRTDKKRASPLSRPRRFRDSSAMASTTSHRELHHRNNDGIDVWLMWDPGTDAVHVRVRDAKAGSAFEIPVTAPASAMDVFHHPFAYAV
jgi:hypothetical protein